MFQMINNSAASHHVNVWQLILLLFLSIGANQSTYAQCQNLAGEPIILTPLNQNTNPDYTTLFVLTDYQGLILELNSNASFIGKPAGVYKAYSIQYLSISGISNLIVGSYIGNVYGSCYDISQALIVNICMPSNAPCQSYSDTIDFSSTAYNTALNTQYALTDSLGTIIQISATSIFTNVNVENYLIYGINYENVIGLSIGSSIHNLSGTCYKISNPIWYKNCAVCNVDLGNNVQICNGSSVTLSPINPLSGDYIWSNGQQGNAIIVSPSTTTSYSVIFTNASQCIAYDTISVVVNTCSVSNCYAEAGEDIDLQSNGQNIGQDYMTQYVLTDYMNTIIQISNTPHFSGQSAGVYKVYGINYNNLLGIQGLTIGNGIELVFGPCFEISVPFEIIICAPAAAACNTFNGQYTFIGTGGNLSLTTQYILADGSNVIQEISNTPEFDNLGVGQFAIYSINYSNAVGLNIGQPVKNIDGECYEISNPIWIKSCENCSVQLPQDTSVCNGQSIIIAANAPVGGSYSWNTGHISSSITVSPQLTESYQVAYTNAEGCISYDTIIVTVINCNLCDTYNCAVACTSCDGNIQFNASGENPTLTTLYLLTDSLGNILELSSIKQFQNVNEGTYFVFAVNYDASKPNTGLIVGSNYFAIQGECLDISQPLIVRVCAQSNVGNFVWLDNGQVPNTQDGGDIGLNGVVLQLYSAAQPNTPISTVTSTNHPVLNTPGYYQFDICKSGNYFIKVIPSGYVLVAPGQGDETVDSDISDLINFTTEVFYVNEGDNLPNIDVGLMFGALPVEYLLFSGHRDHIKKYNVLDWITASEINSDFFILEKSINGKQFSFVEKIIAAGNSLSEIKYQTIDKDASTIGQYTYRLLLHDFDGRISPPQFAFINVDYVEGHQISVYPNPTMQDVFVRIDGRQGSNIHIDLIDITGKLIYASIVSGKIENDINIYRLDVSNYPDNTYILKVILDDVTTYHFKLVKTN